MSVGGSLLLVKLLTFEADPVALVLVVRAERGGHHGHGAAWADRRAVVRIHVESIRAPRGRTVLAQENSLCGGPVLQDDP